MQANPLTVAQLFGRSIRYCIPIFQRHYVWNLNIQWEPFWNDILSKTLSRLDKHVDVYPHYVGAIVLEALKGISVCNVQAFNTIDGQQRLATFQIFFAAMRDISSKVGLEPLNVAIKRHLLNPDQELMADKEIEKYKVWPTQFDRDIFSDIMLADSREDIRTRNIQYFVGMRLRQRGYVPQLLKAYIYFYDSIHDFLNQENEEYEQKVSVEDKLNYLYNCFRNDFKVVEIQLDQGDDAQVIFETLNARGTPLEASDLIRNYIFYRTDYRTDDQTVLFNKYWQQYEKPFWSVNIKQGRIVRSRLEFFFIDFLTSQIAYEINHKRIFQEYKQFIQFKKPFNDNVEKELQTINDYSSTYKIMVEPKECDYFSLFSNTIKIWDISTVNPLLLYIMHSNIDDYQKHEILDSIESYLIRRAICGKTAKNYNKIFLYLLKTMKANQISTHYFNSLLASLKGESGIWPDDNEFKVAWLQKRIYKFIPSRKIEGILKKIETFERNRFSEDVEIKSPLSVEHIMPKGWQAKWPLCDGTIVNDELKYEAYWSDSEIKKPLYDEINERENLVDTIGNLTLLTLKLNVAISNNSFDIKREHIIEQSALRLNRYYQRIYEWNTKEILIRGEYLFEIANKIWRYPKG